MKTLNGNKIVWLEEWVRQAHPSMKDFKIEGKEQEDGTWKCEIDIPTINQKVEAVAKTEVEAMVQASEKGWELIDSYIKEHPETNILEIYKELNYELNSDLKGRFTSIHLTKEDRIKLGKMEGGEE